MGQKIFKMIFFWFVLICFSSFARSAYLKNVPQTFYQPNGEILRCYASGDEFYRWVHDEKGYTIIRNPTGWYVYAEQGEGTEIHPSLYIAGKDDPERSGIPRNLRLSPQEAIKTREAYKRAQPKPTIENEPHIGTIHNLVVFIRFQGEVEYSDSPLKYTAMMNSAGENDNSMYSYFREASFGYLSILSTIYPNPAPTIVSYQDSHPRDYYRPYDELTNPIGYSNKSDSKDREDVLLKNAVEFMAALVPTEMVIDGDGGGDVDSIIFILSGEPDGWGSILWPHASILYSQLAFINGKRVFDYNVQLAGRIDPGVLSHEMFHTLGAPDLYHYTFDGLNPVGPWDIMAETTNPPPHMGAWMKSRYGRWILGITEIIESGTYTLQPLSQEFNNSYMIRSPYAPTKEYFVIEYRKKTGPFESSLPSEGLLVYRINVTITPFGNNDGPPDEVYIYRPNGTITADGSIVKAAYLGESGRTAINDTTNPSSFLSSGAPGGLDISEIRLTGDTVTFRVNIVKTLPIDVEISSYPDDGVPVQVDPPDINNLSDGITPFTRNYNVGTEAIFTAPESFNGKHFVYWYRPDLGPSLVESRVISFPVNGFSTAKRACYSNELKWIKYLEYCEFGGYNNSPAIGEDGTIYISGRDKLVALDSNGILKWEFVHPELSFTAPSIGTDGTIYVVTRGKVYAVNVNGLMKWEFAFSCSEPDLSPIAISPAGRLYLGFRDSINLGYGRLFALSSEGQLLWEYNPRKGISGFPVIGTDETIYFGTEYNCSDTEDLTFLYALNPDGTLKWKYSWDELGKKGSIISTPAIAGDGSIVFGEYGVINSRIISVYPDGTTKWICKIDVGHNYSGPVIDSDGTIYVGTNEGLQAIGSDGSAKWRFNKEIAGYGNNVISSPVIDSNGVIYFCHDRKRILCALNRHGELLWSAYSEYGNSSPAIRDDGALIILGGSFLLAFDTGSNGLASSAWPKYQHDNRNSGHMNGGSGAIITLTAPNGGESWVVGTSRNITWATNGTVANIKLEYSTDDGTNWTSIVTTTANMNSYAWIVPSDTSTECLVRVSEAATGIPADVSNANFTITTSVGAPTIHLTRTSFNFGAEQNNTCTQSGTSVISNTGSGTLIWTATKSADWISVTPQSGTGSRAVTIGITRTDLSIGSHLGIISFTDFNASNSPQTIAVKFTVYPVGGSGSPFGSFDTPVNNATVMSSIAVTGWALDDIEVTSVKIYRNPVGAEAGTRIYIGDGTFIEGSRPDVEAIYPSYPLSYRSGWGYMLLTNFMPGGGNGTFTLYAYATDKEGHEVLIGSKTITCDNLHAVKPFGAIDTPTQGGEISGALYYNFGWALTPMPNMIPTDGSTLGVWVDGVLIGRPRYNNFRDDIAALFPGYANSQGAVGVFDLDTTAYENGMHNIAWSVRDNAGNEDGIGSRFFWILNTNSPAPEGQFERDGEEGGRNIIGAGSQGALARVSDLVGFRDIDGGPIYVRRGFDRSGPPESVVPRLGEGRQADIEIRELEHLEILLDDKAWALDADRRIAERAGVAPAVSGSVAPKASIPQKEARWEGYLVVGDELRCLPIGSTLDTAAGIFSWLPGPGFLGDYTLAFVNNETMKKTALTIRIGDKLRKGVRD